MSYGSANVPTSALREAAVAAIPARPSPPPAPLPPPHKCPVTTSSAPIEWALDRARMVRGGGRLHTGDVNVAGVLLAAAATSSARPGDRFLTSVGAVAAVIGRADSTVRRYLRELGCEVDRHGNVLLPVRAEEGDRG